MNYRTVIWFSFSSHNTPIPSRLRESLSNAAEAQRGAQRAAAAAAADKDASERRLQDAEAKIQEITMELERKDEVIRCVLHTFSTYLPLACDVG